MTYPTTYDHWLSQSWAAHMPPEYSWLWFKGQAIAESDLDPNARSPVGALGLFQFMPDSWGDMKEALNFPALASPLQPQYAIIAGAYYMRELWNAWTAHRTPLDRLHLAHASYNAGLGAVLHAQARAGGANDYLTISQHLPSETVAYVTRIGAIYLQLTEGVPSP